MTDSDRLVDDAQSLADLVDAISEAPLVALDTEFVREQTYYPRLCLIQVATPDRLACVDCLAEMDLKPLFSALLAHGRTWLLHSARQDLEAMQRLMFRLPSRLIDTQIAAALLGKTPQIGLQDLVAGELNVHLDKGFTRTNWAARPLPGGALQYALDDVCHLFALWGALRKKLNDLGRLDWLEEDCRTALETPVLTPPAALWSRLRGVRALNARTRCSALALVEWRESCAQRLNRPRRWLCSDQLLVRIAKTMPSHPGDLSGIPELPKRFARRFGDEIVSAIAASKTEKNLRLVDVQRAPIQESQFKRLRDGARQRARKLSVDPQVLATRQELLDLLRGKPSGRITEGWRWNQLKGLV
ncbi:MAG: HRDC domain-containing protein [Rhodospirillaceae bacterium]|nr:HRDC domain-containing protein [Rhodospirillaceae bacterium]